VPAASLTFEHDACQLPLLRSVAPLTCRIYRGMSESPSPNLLGFDVSERLVRLAELESAMSSLRHDLRGNLTTALLIADRLCMHLDPKVVRAGETLVQAMMQAEERLVATRTSQATHPTELRILRRAGK